MDPLIYVQMLRKMNNLPGPIQRCTHLVTVSCLMVLQQEWPCDSWHHITNVIVTIITLSTSPTHRATPTHYGPST